MHQNLEGISAIAVCLELLFHVTSTHTLSKTYKYITSLFKYTKMSNVYQPKSMENGISLPLMLIVYHGSYDKRDSVLNSVC